MAVENPVVISNATGCLEVGSTIYPYTSWKVPWIHSAFENSAATISGVETVYEALKEEGSVTEDIRFIAIGGDGGTYDIGLQALSGALERGHNFTYICYDNEAYMNTGMQRSSASAYGSWTTTTPLGKIGKGKAIRKKPLTDIVAAHRIPYVAQAAPGHWRDLMNKVQKALATEGPSFLNILQPCVPGWRIEPYVSMKVAKLAVETCYWPLYEVENGVYRVTVKPKEKKPLTEYLELQGRFRHLLAEEQRPLLDELHAEVDTAWEELLAKSSPAETKTAE
jgi:pyruvate ferredoxin oxidoreductase beta subunit